MLDKTNALQQKALGIVGVNLIYGACMLHHNPDQLIESLLDNLSTERIEIDMIEFSGIEFRHVDNRLMSLKLVQLGLSNAAMFGPGGDVLQPSEVLRKRPILVERGSFRPVTHTNLDILRCAFDRFKEEEGVEEGRILQLMEITMNNLMATGELDYRDFLARADMLGACGMTVLISNYFEYYRLAAYLRRYTEAKIGITMGRGQSRRTLRREVLQRTWRRDPRVLRPSLQKRSQALYLPSQEPPEWRRPHHDAKPRDLRRSQATLRPSHRARLH